MQKSINGTQIVYCLSLTKKNAESSNSTQYIMACQKQLLNNTHVLHFIKNENILIYTAWLPIFIGELAISMAIFEWCRLLR